MYNLIEISEIENALVKSAAIEYGYYYENANSLVSLASSFFNKVDFDFWIFLSLQSQVQNSLSLALLSTLRRHDVQTNMMLRHALEACVLACYAVHSKNENDFVKQDPNGIVVLDTKVRKKANEWLETNYKSYSDRIKFMKEHINSTSAHANFKNAFINTDFSSQDKILINFFDSSNSDMEHFRIMTMQRLWWIGNIAFGTIDLVSKVIYDYKAANLIDNFTSIMKELGAQNKKLMDELKQNPRFAKEL
jgi:hypothetical protein